jgi:SPP1 gp7 family putative phage head morphogenesis protein
MPKSDVENALERYRALLLARDADLAESLVSQYARVKSRLQAQIAEAALQIAEAQSRGNAVLTAQRLYQMDRYQELLAAANAETLRFSSLAASQVTQAVGENLQEGIAAGTDLVRASYLEAGRVVGAFHVLPVDAVGFQVGFTQAGTPFGALIRSAAPEMADLLTAQIVEGVATGAPLRTIAQWIKATANDTLNMPLNRALVIARTEPLRAYRAANAAQMSAAGITQYQRRAALSTRTCPSCLALDGKIYPTDDMFVLHPMCRCVQRPLLPGITPSGPSGAEWFKSLTEKQQLEIVGPGRMEYLRQGGDFSRLATVKDDPVWGKTIRQTPLKDLEKTKD